VIYAPELITLVFWCFMVSCMGYRFLLLLLNNVHLCTNCSTGGYGGLINACVRSCVCVCVDVYVIPLRRCEGEARWNAAPHLHNPFVSVLTRRSLFLLFAFLLFFFCLCRVLLDVFDVYIHQLRILI
jgi:hypothetical protein